MMGSLCTAQVDETPGYKETVTNTDIPQWVSQGGQELFTQAKNLATQPYQPYTEQRIASFTGDEQTAFDMARGNLGSYKPYMDQAQTFITNSATPWNSAAATQYMNPYQQNVTDIAAREYNRKMDINQANTRGQATMGAGGFGGGRQGVLEAENERSRALGLSDLQLKGQAEAYNNAQTMFGNDQSRMMQGALASGQLGQVSQSLGVNDAAALERIGAADRALTQRSLDTAYQDFQEQRQNPYDMTNFATGVLKGVPYETTKTDSSNYVNPQLSSSPLGQGAGALSGLVGAYQLYGGKTP
jgi:hypothetical protein